MKVLVIGLLLSVSVQVMAMPEAMMPMGAMTETMTWSDMSAGPSSALFSDFPIGAVTSGRYLGLSTIAVSLDRHTTEREPHLSVKFVADDLVGALGEAIRSCDDHVLNADIFVHRVETFCRRHNEMVHHSGRLPVAPVLGHTTIAGFNSDYFLVSGGMPQEYRYVFAPEVLRKIAGLVYPPSLTTMADDYRYTLEIQLHVTSDHIVESVVLHHRTDNLLNTFFGLIAGLFVAPDPEGEDEVDFPEPEETDDDPSDDEASSFEASSFEDSSFEDSSFEDSSFEASSYGLSDDDIQEPEPPFPPELMSDPEEASQGDLADQIMALLVLADPQQLETIDQKIQQLLATLHSLVGQDDEVDSGECPYLELGSITMRASRVDRKEYNRMARISHELASNLNSVVVMQKMKLERMMPAFNSALANRFNYAMQESARRRLETWRKRQELQRQEEQRQEKQRQELQASYQPVVGDDQTDSVPPHSLVYEVLTRMLDLASQFRAQ